jgi:IS1 family transposase
MGGEIISGLYNGDPREIRQLRGVNSGGKINTAYIEQLNLIIRNLLARFVRKGMNRSKSWEDIVVP